MAATGNALTSMVQIGEVGKSGTGGVGFGEIVCAAPAGTRLSAARSTASTIDVVRARGTLYNSVCIQRITRSSVGEGVEISPQL